MMGNLIDKCPKCGGSLTAHCAVVATYSIKNYKDEQDWNRLEVDDDESQPIYISCDDCREEWHVVKDEVELSEDGQYLIGLKRAGESDEAPECQGCPADSIDECCECEGGPK